MFLNAFKSNFNSVFLGPLNDPAFIVRVLVHQKIQVDMLIQNFFEKEFLCKLVSTVEIYGTHKGFQHVAINVF